MNPVPVDEGDEIRIDPSDFGLGSEDSVNPELLKTEGSSKTVSKLIQELDRIYCGPTAVEFEAVQVKETRAL